MKLEGLHRVMLLCYLGNILTLLVREKSRIIIWFLKIYFIFLSAWWSKTSYVTLLEMIADFYA